MVFSLLFGAVAYFLINFPDSFDRKKLVTTVSDESASNHAAIAEYHHSDSSADVMAAWLLEGRFEQITEDDLSGRPEVVWSTRQPMPRMAWQNNGRLLIEVAPPFDFRSQILFSCYDSEGVIVGPYLCAASSKVDIRVAE